MELNLVPIRSPATDKTHSFYVLKAGAPGAALAGFSFSTKATPDQLAQTIGAVFAEVAEIIGEAQGKLIVPISSRALIGRENATVVVESLRLIEKSLRPKLILEIHDFPSRISLDAVEDIIIPLLFYAGGFIARIPAGLDDATTFANCNFIGLSDDAQSYDDVKHLRSVWALATPRRLKVFVWNLNQEFVADAARMEISGYTKAL